MNSIEELPPFPEGWYFVTSRSSLQGLIRRQEVFIVAHSGDIALLLQSHFGLGLLCPGDQYRMTAAAGLQPRKGGLNFFDLGDHGTPEGGGSFIQPGLGEINIAAQS